MRCPYGSEHGKMGKGAILEELALSPLKSVMQIRSTLYKHGYQAINGPLDYHYVSRLVKEIRVENILALNATTRAERLAIFRERHRAITERLADILDGKPSQSFDKPNYPTNGDRVAAAATILKWDMALLVAEEQNVFAEKVTLPRALSFENQKMISLAQNDRNACVVTR
jgi:hypothetical protein